jgi:hypothetical protein
MSDGGHWHLIRVGVNQWNMVAMEVTNNNISDAFQSRDDVAPDYCANTNLKWMGKLSVAQVSQSNSWVNENSSIINVDKTTQSTDTKRLGCQNINVHRSSLLGRFN